MDPIQFKKLTSRILRHSGFKTRINKAEQQYELCHDSSPTAILYCRPLITQEGDQSEYYLCFSLLSPFTSETEKLYNRLIKRFTRLAPSIMINLEKLFEPIFTDQEFEQIEELVNQYKGDQDETE